jgi:hypothetical protein
MTISPPRNSLSQNSGLILGICFCFGFTGLIWIAGDRLETFELRPDREIAFWYPWVSAAPTI